MKQFKLRDPRSKDYFLVRVHDTLKLMREAILEHEKETGEEHNEALDDTYGTCHTFEKFRILPDGSELISNHIGIIQLAKRFTTTEVITHELVHAAMHQYRREAKRPANFGEGCDTHEEVYAHIYGRLFRDMTKKLYKHNFWH